VRLAEEFADWCWRPRYCGGDFDFADEAYFRRGVDLFLEMVRKRHTRARPITPTISRQQFGMVSMLYRLKAKIDFREIAEQEIKATGWDRSEYAPSTSPP
jgi:aarF domain-containing kinase